MEATAEGVMEELRRLSEAATQGPFSVSGVRRRYNEASCVIVDAPTCPGLVALATADGTAALQSLSDAKFLATSANYVRTLLSAPPAAQDGWRDIATAPKDGTAILAIWPQLSHPAVGAWMKPTGYTLHWCANFAWTPGPDPTHWMPLPSPPSPSEKDPFR